MIRSLLIANRGEIARRIQATTRRLGVRDVVVHAAVDRDLPFVREASEAVELEAARPADAYRDGDQIIQAALDAGAEAIHPGYGFLSENAEFAQAVTDAGLIWVGPSPRSIELMGDKAAALAVMARIDPDAASGSGPHGELGEALGAAERLGYPVMVKAVAGGGGMAMSVAHDDASLATAVAAVTSRAERLYGDARFVVERFIERARHIEVQVFGTPSGVLVLGDRDCSAQRRYQKVVEEAPAAFLSDATRERLHASASALAESVEYRGAGTVEFLVDAVSESHVFCEMNTRLQVEHPVTELVAGVDLVEQQLRLASGEYLTWSGPPVASQHAIEFRICAEHPFSFVPQPGTIQTWDLPTDPWVRTDAGFGAGNEVSMYFDSLVAKLCVVGPDRDQAIARARDALARSEITGITTNLPLLRAITDDPTFTAGGYTTGLVSTLVAQRAASDPSPDLSKGITTHA